MIRLAVRVPREQAEVVLAELLDLAPAGVEELAVDGGRIEYAVYGPPGELPALPDLRALAGGATVEISTSEIADDWQERWREFHKPVLIEAPQTAVGAQLRALPAIRVRPPWEPAAGAEADAIELVIDPGQAFGTGGHASTRLCLALLLELADADGTELAVLDVGTGSGVLAIAAGRLGFAPLLGLDNEAESVEAAAVNATANDVELQSERFDLRDEPLPWLGGAPRNASEAPARGTLLIANLLRPLLLELCETIERPPAGLIAGGLLIAELDEVARAYAGRHGLLERRRRTEGDWGALWLAPPPGLAA
ncbi:MAG TPA: 50S ribosomal protein L11 methyltransferase [Solirubrobacteraceae bacterium]